MTGPVRPLRGITWDHPRGYAALAELERLDVAADGRYGRVPEPLRWDRQPLAAFESTPIAGLATRYDILVIDHPGLGAASASLLPLDELFSAWELDAWAAGAVGACFGSYRYTGRQWALPLDAATQVCVVRPDLAGGCAAPVTWQDVVTLAHEVPIALVLGGPHALLTLLAMCAAHGDPPVTEDGAGSPVCDFAETDTARGGVLAALELLAVLYRRCDPSLAAGNPIEVLETMATEDAAACCPLVYGYVTYSEPGRRPHVLSAHGAPAWTPGGRPGSVLGGSGLALSRRVAGNAKKQTAAMAHLRRLLAEPVQEELVPRVGGQPALRGAWESATVNAACGGFYQRTRATLEQAWVRPRFPGWIAFQDEGSTIVRNALVSREVPEATLRRLRDAFRAHCLSN